MGLLFTTQLKRTIASELGSWIGNDRVEHWLQQRVFQSGASQAWPEHIVVATGEGLNPDYFIDKISI